MLYVSKDDGSFLLNVSLTEEKKNVEEIHRIFFFFFRRKHLQSIDPFVEMKQRTFYSSHKAIDVLLGQLNVDVDSKVDLIENKSTVEQQFYNYVQVRRKLWTFSVRFHRCLDRTLGECL